MRNPVGSLKLLNASSGDNNGAAGIFSLGTSGSCSSGFSFLLPFWARQGTAGIAKLAKTSTRRRKSNPARPVFGAVSRRQNLFKQYRIRGKALTQLPNRFFKHEVLVVQFHFHQR